MLQRLRIENFILIETLDLRFHRGIGVLTGETGAGKSIIIDAVTAVLGGKAANDTIRTGAGRARIEATFQLEPLPASVARWLAQEGIEPELAGELSVSREITPRGGRCRVEGVPVAQASLRVLGEALVDILGQHEHTLLTRAREHLYLVDRFGGLEPKRAQVADAHARLSAIASELAALEAATSQSERQRDFWQYQLTEIDEADLQRETEEAELKAERTLLANAEDLRRTLAESYDRLSAGEHAPSLVDGLTAVVQALEASADLDPELTPVAQALEDALSAIEDSARELRRRFERLEADPVRLGELEARLDLIRDLLRKYGPTINDLWAYRDRVRFDLQRADSAGDRLEMLQNERLTTERELREHAAALTEARRAAANRLETLITSELADLGMKEARFEAAFRRLGEIGADGAETLEFMLAPNPGEPPRPLAKTASGGELARLMLALKTVLVRSDVVPTLIFDEVDTGISGRAAQVVAQKIASLANRYQILLITHMPAIAAIADHHWHIEKRMEAGRTRLAVELLNAEGQVAELAHLASGDASSGAASDHARELLARASAYKAPEIAR